jgi:LysM repeat protein
MQSNPEFKAVQDSELIALNQSPSVKTYRNASRGHIVYKVRRGDKLAQIANDHNVTIDELRKWNHLRSKKIKTGQKLRINRA